MQNIDAHITYTMTKSEEFQKENYNNLTD